MGQRGALVPIQYPEAQQALDGTLMCLSPVSTTTMGSLASLVHDVCAAGTNSGKILSSSNHSRLGRRMRYSSSHSSLLLNTHCVYQYFGATRENARRGSRHLSNRFIHSMLLEYSSTWRSSAKDIPSHNYVWWRKVSYNSCPA